MRGATGEGACEGGVRGGRNGGRARCPYRAARVMRVGNGGASRESRRPTVAPGARPCRAPCRGQSRGMQNSQRVLLAKPRTAPVARRRDGDIAPYRNGARAVRTATGHGEGRRSGVRARGAGCQAAHRGGEPPRAKERGGAMGTSRPTAKPHEGSARAVRGAREADGNIARARCAGGGL